MIDEKHLIDRINKAIEKEKEAGEIYDYMESDLSYVVGWLLTEPKVDCACTHCGNNIANGGSGICNCILGTKNVYTY